MKTITVTLSPNNQQYRFEITVPDHLDDAEIANEAMHAALNEMRVAWSWKEKPKPSPFAFFAKIKAAINNMSFSAVNVGAPVPVKPVTKVQIQAFLRTTHR